MNSDGGEVYRDQDGNRTGLPANSTYSLRVASSWDPASVRLTRIEKGDAPVYNRANLFPNTDDRSFFSYNGDLSHAIKYYPGYDPPDNPQLWQFTPNGAGGGTWTLFDTIITLTQSENAGLATANGSAYLLGVKQNWRTTTKFYDVGDDGYINTQYQASADGLVVYDMDSREWVNRTITEFRPSGWAYEVQLQHLQGFGDGNLLLAMGGKTNTGSDSWGSEILIPYETVSIYNTETQEWRNQTTTGEIPDGRDETVCCVGVAGDRGTYEVSSYPQDIC